MGEGSALGEFPIWGARGPEFKSPRSDQYLCDTLNNFGPVFGLAQVMDNTQLINRIASALREKLTPHGIGSRAGYAQRVAPDEQHFNSGEYIEIRAFRRGQVEFLELTRVMRIEDPRTTDAAGVADKFADQALSVLRHVTVK